MMHTELSSDYINCGTLAVWAREEDHTFSCLRAGRGRFADRVALRFEDESGAAPFALSDYGHFEYRWLRPWNAPFAAIALDCSAGRRGLPDLRVEYRVDREKIVCSVWGLPAGVTPVFSGDLFWGKGDDCMAVCLNRSDKEHDLRSACGPAVSRIDDALFDRAADEALEVCGSISRRLSYSYQRECYAFEVRGTLTLRPHDRLYETRFHTPYGPINKHSTFPKPPAGWMTWYALKFDACEEAVLRNAEWQREHLAPYGADAIWIDWEWYHSGLDCYNAPENVGFLHPDPARYPHGLKYVAERIRRLGFVPALWVAPTNEPAMSELSRSFADTIVLDSPETWCGRYFFDITDERVRDELIPRTFGMLKEWGFDALKWDCLPITQDYADRCHAWLKHPEITTEEAMRALIAKARETVGEDFYMLSCSGDVDRVDTLAPDLFDAERIGGDIFTWEEYIANFVERILRFYPYHNVQFYCDPDNVVLRPEFNTLHQARSRVSAVSLLGLPITFGDDLTKLPEERVELLRRALPTLDIHPKDIRETTHDGKRFLMHLLISRPFEDWDVAGLTNLKSCAVEAWLDFDRELHLDPGRYLVYDFWCRKFLGVHEGGLSLTLRGNGTAVLSLRRVTGRPQVLSTGRHLTQGAPDLLDVSWDEESRTLRGRSETVRGEDYRLEIYVPEGFVPVSGEAKDRVLTLTLAADEGGPRDWEVRFA